VLFPVPRGTGKPAKKWQAGCRKVRHVTIAKPLWAMQKKHYDRYEKI